MGKLCSDCLILPSMSFLFLFFFKHSCCINQPVSFLLTSLQSIGFSWSNASRLCFQILAWSLPSLSIYFSFLLFYSPPPLFWSLSSTLLGVQSQTFFFYVRGILPECMHSTLAFLRLELHCHWFPLLCIPPQFCIWDNIRPKDHKSFPKALVYKCLQVIMIFCVTFHMQNPGSTCVSICWIWNCAFLNLLFSCFRYNTVTCVTCCVSFYRITIHWHSFKTWIGTVSSKVVSGWPHFIFFRTVLL